MHKKQSPTALRKLTATGIAAATLLLTTGCFDTATAPAEEINNYKEIAKSKTPGDKWTTEAMPGTTAADPQTCEDVLFITARGTSEPPVTGNLLSPVKRALEKAVTEPEDKDAKQQTFEHIDIDYPASAEFGDSTPEGMRKLIDLVNSRATHCPEQKIVLAGYSQGAYLIGESLTAPDYRLLGTAVGEVSAEAREAIKGIIFYGDPRFLSTDSFNYGTFKPGVDGAIPRVDGVLDSYADRIRSFCVADDIVCQTQKDDFNETGHVAYFDNGMQDAGVEFLTALLAGKQPPK